MTSCSNQWRLMMAGLLTLAVGVCGACGDENVVGGPSLALFPGLPQTVVLTTLDPVTIRSETDGVTVEQLADVVLVTAHQDGRLLIAVDGGETFSVAVVTSETSETAPEKHCGNRQCLARGLTVGGTPLLAVTPLQPGVGVGEPTRVRRKATDAQYPLVFPFFALELLGETLESDTADLNPNLDAVNALAYERHHLQDGQFVVRTPITSDPKAYADAQGLPAWPMLTHDRPITEEDIATLFAARSTIIADAVTTAVERDYAGYVLDVEVSFTSPASPRAQYLTFVRELTSALHAVDKKLMVATARWINLAPIADLAATDVDYIASMDPMHPGGEPMWLQKIPPTYADVPDPSRLIWVFSWDFFRDAEGHAEQLAQLQWMEDNGYNAGVAGASCFRTPMATPNPFHSIDYYAAFRAHYPAAEPGAEPLVDGTIRGIVFDQDRVATAGEAEAADALLTTATIDCDTCDVALVVDSETAAWRAELLPGTYAFTASLEGYTPTTRVVTVTAGTTVWASLGLSRAPAAVEPDATEPDATEPDATEPDATEPDATEPDATEPDVVEPEPEQKETPVPGDKAPLPGSVRTQCACTTTPSSRGSFLALALFGLIAMRRRTDAPNRERHD